MTKLLDAVSINPGITVNDLDRSLAFYQGLGFEIGERWERDGKLLGVMLTAGAVNLGVSQDDFAKGRDRVKGVGLRIWIDTNQNVDELAARVRAAGVVLDADPADMPWGGRSFNVTDPDGFKLTVSNDGKS